MVGLLIPLVDLMLNNSFGCDLARTGPQPHLYTLRPQPDRCRCFGAHRAQGVFAFGNAQQGERQVSSLLYSRLCALNSPVFDFLNCNFTEKNMSRADKVRIQQLRAA